MVCEANDVVCQGLGFLADNEFITTAFAELIATEAKGIDGVVGTIAGFVTEYSQAIVGLIVGSFGAWKWWHYREKILHKRLAEYLAVNDNRLKVARRDVLGALNRPNPRRPFSDPIFAGKELRRVLRERRWDPSASVFASVTSRASRDLDVAIGKIERKIGTAEETLASYHNHLASAHILRGAVAATRAPHSFNGKQKRDFNTQALNHFRTALKTPGFSQNIEAKEYEAHQLRKIGDFNLALKAYNALERNSSSLEGKRAKDLHLARCRRYRAEIHQAKAIQEFRDGQRESDKTTNANNLMVSQNQPMQGALVLRNQYVSVFQTWDLIEQGDMLFLTAFICSKLEFREREKHHRSEAETAYERVLESIPSGKWLLSNSEKRLKAAAVAGKNRILASRHGVYDDSWLLPPSLQQSKNKPQCVSTPRGN